MKRLMIIGLWPDDTVNYCTEKCDCRRYAFDRILYHKGGRAARERICIPVVDRSGAVTTYLDLPVTLLEAGVVYLRLDDGSDIFLGDTQMALIANEVERQRAECAGTGLKTLGKSFKRRSTTSVERPPATRGPRNERNFRTRPVYEILVGGHPENALRIRCRAGYFVSQSTRRLFSRTSLDTHTARKPVYG